jgi:hypothetical protein
MRPVLSLILFSIFLTSSSVLAKPKPSPVALPKPLSVTIDTAKLVGRWSGFYIMAGPTGQMKISFMLNLRAKGEVVEGEVTENNPNPNDREKPSVLRSTLKGRVVGPRITFVKTYDSDLQQVEYTGDIQADHRHMSGGWTNSGASGPFEADLVAPTESH